MAAAEGMSGLCEVALYHRRVLASAERVWENVHDWAHLPFLHSAAFRGIRCERADGAGWRARVALANGGEIDLELALDADGSSYHARTLAGAGTGTDIWTRVTEAGLGATDIAVGFYAPSVRAETRDALGAAFVKLYTRLWNEDEAMMQHRQAFLDGVAPRVPRAGARAPQPLGPVDALRSRLPLTLTLDPGADRFVVREHAGRFVAHAAVCPHWGASLEGAAIDDGAVVCPWHGYRYDLASGRGPCSQRCRMPARAEVRVGDGGQAWLVIQ